MGEVLPLGFGQWETRPEFCLARGLAMWGVARGEVVGWSSLLSPSLQPALSLDSFLHCLNVYGTDISKLGGRQRLCRPHRLTPSSIQAIIEEISLQTRLTSQRSVLRYPGDPYRFIIACKLESETCRYGLLYITFT